MQLSVGDRAPDFNAVDQNGNAHQLREYKGDWLLLYFYPKDDTPGCTMEACAFRDAQDIYRSAGIHVVGVSIDTQQKHRKFADKYGLPFTLLADPEKVIVKAYGVWGKKKFMGREYMGTKRVSFLIDPKGRIARIYDSVKPAAHAQEVLEDQGTLGE